MKRIFSIIFFLCLAIKPAYKLGYVAYFELNINTIVEKYCVNKAKPQIKCNGKCHLAKKLALTKPSSKDNQKVISNSLSEAFLPVYFEKSNIDSSLYEPIEYKAKYWSIITKKYKTSLHIKTPPPQIYFPV